MDQRRIREYMASHPYRLKIDMTDAYYQIRVIPEHEERNAITAGSLGAWQVKVMLQGDKNAPATMMRVMNSIFTEYLGKFVWIYLDDIFIFSNTRDEHIGHLRQVFRTLQKHNFYLCRDKCDLMMDEIEILGHTIKGNQIIPTKERIREITDFRVPRDKKELQRFLGTVNYVGGHLPHLATLQAPLTELTGNEPWRWTDLHQRAFTQIISACRLYLPLTPHDYPKILDPTSVYKVYLVTDASKVGVGSFLCHGWNFQDAKLRIAAMHSRKFTPAQFSYSTTDKELLAIVDALRNFECLLLGIKFTIRTDHMALQTLMKRITPNERQIRWLEKIKVFDFDIEHIDGKENILADALSRIYEDNRLDAITEQDYVGEDNMTEETDINTDEFPPVADKTPDNNRKPLLATGKQTTLANSTPLSPVSNSLLLNKHPIFIQRPIPTLHRENAKLKEEENAAMATFTTVLDSPDSEKHSGTPELHGGNQADHQSNKPSIRWPHGIPYSTSCCTDALDWENCSALGRCDGHLSDCIDTTRHKMVGNPSGSISTCAAGSTSATTSERDATVPPWRQPKSPEPYQPTYTDEQRKILHQSIWLNGTADQILKRAQDDPGSSYHGIPTCTRTTAQRGVSQMPQTIEPQHLGLDTQQQHAMPVTIQDTKHQQEQQQLWEECPVQRTPSIFATLQSTQGSPSPPLVAQVLTRAQRRRNEAKKLEESAKRKLENVLEKVTGLRQTRSQTKKLTEGTSKVGGIEKKQRLDKDKEVGDQAGQAKGRTDKGKEKEINRMEEDTESELDGSDADHDPEDKPVEDETSELSDLDWSDDLGEPAILYNENAGTVWGAAYFEALKQDPDYGEGAIICEPFYKNAEGFILKSHLYHRPRVYIPKGRVRIRGELYDMRELLIHSTHGRLAHFGTTKTYNDLRQGTFWAGQWKQVQRFVASWDVCQRTKQPTQKPEGLARMLTIPDRPWESISIDSVGPFPASGGMESIIVIVHRFSSAIRLIPMHKGYRARDICQALITEIYSRLGKPHEIITDRGPQLVSSYFTEMQKAFQVDLLPSTAFHQQTNGSAEKAVKTVVQILRAYVNERQNDWITHLWRAEYAMNNSSVNWSERTPNEICYGTHGQPLKHFKSKNDAVNQHLEHMDLNNKIAHDEITATQVKQARYAQDGRNANKSFNVGDYVMYQRRTWKKHLSHKLHTVWKGPYKVTKVDKFGNCTLDIPKKYNRHPVFATDMLKLYHNDPEHGRDPTQLVIHEDYEPLYPIERIIDQRKHQGKDQYLVKWQGYDEDENTWEVCRKIEEDAPEIVEQYNRMLGTDPIH
jgi:hypothetical protein